MKEFSYRDVEAATEGFALDRLIGKGSHGCIYKGTFKDGKHVAVKKPSQGLQFLQEGSKLDNEIDLLASIHSPNLVNLIGVSQSPTDKLLVMEFMPNGSLHHLLHSSEPPTWSHRTIMALQIARAVSSLHEAKPPIIHRDIKSDNILLDRRWNARLADFSLAVRDDSLSVNNSKSTDPAIPAGTIGYLDPCYTTPGKLSPKNDVFSFGVLLLELISSRQVMDMACDPTSIVAWAIPLIKAHREVEVCDSRVLLPNNTKRAIGDMLRIAARCVSTKEERRPSMGDVVVELQTAMEGVRFPVWCHLKSKFSRRIRTCSIRAWRTRSINRVTTIKIELKDHLNNDDDDDDDG